MTCPVCKRENIGRSLTCAFCGADLPLTPPDAADPKPAAAQKRPNTSKKTVSVIAVSVLLVIAFILVAVGFLNRKSKGDADYIYVKQDVFCHVEGFGDRFRVFVNGEAVSGTIDGILARYDQCSMDNSVTLFRVIERGVVFTYLLHDKELSKLEGSERWGDVVLSASGERLAYTVSDEERGETSLYLYDVADGSASLIDAGEQIDSVALSPDGKSLAYVMRVNMEFSGKNSSATFFFDGERRTYLGENLRPIALSNGGSYIYTRSLYRALHVYSKDGNLIQNIRIGQDGVLFFNADFTQLLYHSDNNICISVNGEEGVPFFNSSSASMILPVDTRYVCISGSDDMRTYPVRSFYDQCYYSKGEIYQVKQDSTKGVRLASNVFGVFFTMSRDGSQIYYLSNNERLRMTKPAWGEKATENAVTLARDIFAGIGPYTVTADGSLVYYFDYDGNLFSVKEDGESRTAIDEGVSGNIGDLFIGQGDNLYYHKNGDLYCYDGESAELVLRDGHIFERGYLGYCYIYSGDALYCVAGDKELKKLPVT